MYFISHLSSHVACLAYVSHVYLRMCSVVRCVFSCHAVLLSCFSCHAVLLSCGMFVSDCISSHVDHACCLVLVFVNTEPHESHMRHRPGHGQGDPPKPPSRPQHAGPSAQVDRACPRVLKLAVRSVARRVISLLIKI